MKLWNRRRKSARAIIIEDGKVLLFLRKRYSKISGNWIEYYSIPGGGLDKGETPEHAVIRELREEMNVEIEVTKLVAHGTSRHFENYIFHCTIKNGKAELGLESEEAKSMNELNQYIVAWVEISRLTEKNLRYYAHFLPLIRQLADGNVPQEPLLIKN